MNLLTKKEIATILCVSVSMIDKLMKTGLPYIKLGKSVRFELEKVKLWIEEHRVSEM